MVVIGSFTSANSKRLTQIAQEINYKSYQVTNADELKEEWFRDIETIGVSAGASTPDETIDGGASEAETILYPETVDLFQDQEPLMPTTEGGRR